MVVRGGLGMRMLPPSVFSDSVPDIHSPQALCRFPAFLKPELAIGESSHSYIIAVYPEVRPVYSSEVHIVHITLFINFFKSFPWTQFKCTSISQTFVRRGIIASFTALVLQIVQCNCRSAPKCVACLEIRAASLAVVGMCIRRVNIKFFTASTKCRIGAGYLM